MTDPERIRPADRAARRARLAERAETAGGVWPVSRKGARRTLPSDAIAEEAHCVGWADSLPRSLDASSAMRSVAPRTPERVRATVDEAAVGRRANQWPQPRSAPPA